MAERRASPGGGAARHRLLNGSSALAIAVGALLTFGRPETASGQDCPPPAGNGQVLVDGAGNSCGLVAGSYGTTAAAVPVIYARNGAVVTAPAVVSIRSTGSSAFAVQVETGGSVQFANPASTIVTSGNSAAGLRALAGGGVIISGGVVSTLAGGATAAYAQGGVITSSGATYYTASGGAGGVTGIGLNVINGGAVTSTSDTIVTGVKLGTTSADAAAYGRPVDAGGVLVTDPALYIASGAASAHGGFIGSTGGRCDSMSTEPTRRSPAAGAASPPSAPTATAFRSPPPAPVPDWSRRTSMSGPTEEPPTASRWPERRTPPRSTP